jgi:hypothetical protein
LYRLSTYVPEANLQFNQFLLCDEQPLLLHTGMRGLFPSVKEAVARLIDPATLRWIAFSHFEAEDCRSLREWQSLAPEACALCGLVGKLVSVDDVVAVRPAQALDDGELITPALPAHAARPPLLGYRAVLRGNPGHLALFRPLPSERRCRADHLLGCGRQGQANTAGL